MAINKNSSLCSALVFFLIAAGSANARDLQQQQPSSDAGNVLGGLLSQGLQVANQGIQAVLNATQQATTQAANATVAGTNATNPLGQLGQNLSQALSNLTAGISISPAPNQTVLPGLSPSPNGTNIGQDIGQFFSGVATNLTQGLQQAGQQVQGAVNNTTRAAQAGGSGTAGNPPLTSPFNGASSRAVTLFGGVVAGAVVLLML